MTELRQITETGSIPVLVITERNSHRSDLLVAKLKQISQFEIIMVDAAMTPTYQLCIDRNILYDQELAKVYLGRELFPGEIGCAFSHYSARKIIADSIFGGVILEDDARIIRPDIFFNSVVEFLHAQSERASVLSLAGWRPKPHLEHQDDRFERVMRSLKLFGVPPLALAYALTPSAAKELTDGTYPIKETADWPSSKCSFFVTHKVVAFHGDSGTSSIIDYGGNSLRKRPKLAQRLRTILFFDLIMKRSNQINSRVYFNQVWLRKLFFYIDRSRMFLRSQ
jgi:hypothetical protein